MVELTPDNSNEGANNGASGSWALPEPEPTTLIALWPGEAAPTMTEIVAAINDYLGSEIEVVDELDPEDDGVLWNMVVELPGLKERSIIWAEPAQPLSPDELNDPRALACRWVIGAETLLNPDDPLGEFTALMRTIAGSVEDAPAVLDVNSGRWHPRAALCEQFLEFDIEPAPEMMWLIHAVCREDESSGDAWLYTRGLWRCGRPELEILEVPSALTSSAAELTNAVATWMIDSATPEPGEPIAIGDGISVVLQPWREVVEFVAADAPGGADTRKDDPDNPFAGVRAVICSDEQKGALRKIWTWPAEAIEQLESNSAVLWRSNRTSARESARANATWPRLATAIASVSSDALNTSRDEIEATDARCIRVLVKARFADENWSGDQWEHLWFIVHAIEGDRVDGELANTPVLLQHLSEGDRIWIDRDQLSDWWVFTPFGTFAPTTAAGLEHAIDRFRLERAANDA